MAKRKKRLKKSIVSIQEQIDLHEEKKKWAEESNQPELADYYEREINARTKTREEKKKLLEKN